MLRLKKLLEKIFSFVEEKWAPVVAGGWIVLTAIAISLLFVHSTTRIIIGIIFIVLFALDETLLRIVSFKVHRRNSKLHVKNTRLLQSNRMWMQHNLPQKPQKKSS